MKIMIYDSDAVYKRPKILKRLQFLTNGGWGRHEMGSAMIEDIKDQRKSWILLAWDKGVIVGWSSLCKRLDSSYQISIYVSAKHRRKGIGSRLASKAKKFASELNSEIYSHGWSRSGLRFYKKNKIPYTSRWEF